MEQAGIVFGESMEESGAVRAAVTHVNHTGGLPGASEPPATFCGDLRGFPCSPQPRRAQQCLTRVMAPEKLLLLSPTPCITLLRLNSRNFSQEEGFSSCCFNQRENVGIPADPQAPPCVGWYPELLTPPSASQLADPSIKGLIWTWEHFSAQIEPMINASPWVSDGEKSEATCRCKRGRRRAGGKKINIRNENVLLRVSIFAFPRFLTNFSSDLSVHTQTTTGTLLSFVLGTASPGPRSSLPAQGEVSCATDFT